MKHVWKKEELIEYFTLSSNELKYLGHRTPAGRIGFSILIKFMQHEGRFPDGLNEVPKSVIKHIANQLDLSSDEVNKYKWKRSEAAKVLNPCNIGDVYDFMRFNQLVRTDSLFQFVDPS